MACNCGSVSDTAYKKKWDAETGKVKDCKITSAGTFKGQKMGDICKSTNLVKLSIEDLCRLKGTLDFWKKWSWIKASKGAKKELSDFRKAVCDAIEAIKPMTPKAECEALLASDSNKAKEKEDCALKVDGQNKSTHRWTYNDCKCKKRSTNTNNNQSKKKKEAIQGCMDSTADNYVEGATVPTQCEYKIDEDLTNEYVFCNTAGCLDKNPNNTLERGVNTIVVRPTGGRSPYDYIKEIKNAIYEVVSEYNNQLYPINGIGFYSDEKNDYLHDLALALTIMLFKNKSQLEDYDNFPYKYVSIYGGAMGVPYGTVNLSINNDWGDNLKNVVTAAKIFNSKANFSKLLKIATNNNLSFDLDALANMFNRDVNWLNGNIQNNGYIVSTEGVIKLLEHNEGLGTVLNEMRGPIGLVNLLK